MSDTRNYSDGDPTAPATVGDATTLRTSTTGRLRSLLMDAPDPVLLLGAGASITSGIPAAEATVEKAARWAWCKEHGRHPDDLAIRQSDYRPGLAAQPWYRPDVPLAELYPDAIENLLRVKSDRRQFFEQLINPGVPPSKGYEALTHILHQGWISTVLTTNFDQCIQRASILNNRPHRLVTINTPDDYVTFSSVPHDPQIVFLHGSVEHYTDKNLTAEVQTLDPALVSRLAPLLRDHPTIVVGYRGAEASVMNDLFMAQATSGGFLHGIYWCVLDREPHGALSPWAARLAQTIGSNFQLVPISGFDALFETDLLAAMLAAGARPMRRSSVHSVGGTPADMRPLPGFPRSGLERPLLRARLRQYAERTDIWHPRDLDDAWLEQMVDRLDIVRPAQGGLAPTVAGWLLFSRSPSTDFPDARVEFQATGAAAWLRGRFGDDVEPEPSDRDGLFTVRRTVTGNLWTQLDALLELLALVNFQFRLKGEVSTTVSAYNPIAVKELVVNAVVHRDYECGEPIVVAVEPEFVTVTSPGGLVEGVAAQVGSQSFQEAIVGRTRAIKGYRNPVISDLFYGGGQMDRRGSGLSDVVRLTANNNAKVSFGPLDSNRRFSVTLEARPEAVDEITNTALPVTGGTARYSSNLLAIEAMPNVVWNAPTTASSNRRLYDTSDDLAIPPGHVSDHLFYCFYDLNRITQEMSTPFDPGEVETTSLEALLAQPEGEAIALKLVHELLFEHFRARGLQLDYKRKRAYFAVADGMERKVTYRGRVRKATRTVVKARTRRDGDEVVYYEHKALTFSVMRLGEAWAIVLTPGYAFTRDGARTPLSRERTNSLSTRRGARDFNPTVLHDVAFWVAYLSAEADGLFALEHVEDNPFGRFGPAVLVSHRPATVAFNDSALGELREHDAEIDEELRELEAELEELALAPEEGGEARTGDVDAESGLDDAD